MMDVEQHERVLRQIKVIEALLEGDLVIEQSILTHLSALKESVTDGLKELVWIRYLKGEG